MKRKIPPYWGVLIGLLLWQCVGFAEVKLARPTHYVEDRANVIDAATERSLNGILQELQQKTGAQYIVLTVDTLPCTSQCESLYNVPNARPERRPLWYGG